MGVGGDVWEKYDVFVCLKINLSDKWQQDVIMVRPSVTGYKFCLWSTLEKSLSAPMMYM